MLPPSLGLYNGLQRFAYASALVLGAVQVGTGLAIYKPFIGLADVAFRWIRLGAQHPLLALLAPWPSPWVTDHGGIHPVTIPTIVIGREVQRHGGPSGREVELIAPGP